MMKEVNANNKRRLEDDSQNQADPASYEEYVKLDNEKLRCQLKELRENFERCRKVKERAEEKLQFENELRIKEKRESDLALKNVRAELESARREKNQLETLLKVRNFELDKIKTAINEETAKEDFCCDTCDFKTRSEVSLILHKINHRLTHTNQRKLILHPNMFSLRNPNSTFLYTCPLCEVSLTRNEIYSHIYQFHTKENAYKCMECDLFFTHIDYLRSHITYEHEKHRIDKSKYRNNFDKIIDSISRNPLITSVYKPSYSRATQTVTTEAISASLDLGPNQVMFSPQVVFGSGLEEEKIKCTFPHCTFTTNNKQKLEFHLAAHTNSKYKCPYCAYVGNILSDIYRHVKKSNKHEGIKVFQCFKCDYAVDCERSFREHLRGSHLREDTPEKVIDTLIDNMFLNKHPTMENPGSNSNDSSNSSK